MSTFAHQQDKKGDRTGMWIGGTQHAACCRCSPSDSTRSVSCSATCLENNYGGRCNCRRVFGLVEEKLGECLEAMNLRTRGVRGILFPHGVQDGGGNLKVTEWLFTCTSMLDACCGLHKRSVVHGDIKLANFCMAKCDDNSKQVVKLVDLGVCLSVYSD